MVLIYFRCLGELNSYAAGAYSTLITSSLKYVFILLIFTEIVLLILYMKHKKMKCDYGKRKFRMKIRKRVFLRNIK